MYRHDGKKSAAGGRRRRAPPPKISLPLPLYVETASRPRAFAR
jgi:hypothetical protein